MYYFHWRGKDVISTSCMAVFRRTEDLASIRNSGAEHAVSPTRHLGCVGEGSVLLLVLVLFSLLLFFVRPFFILFPPSWRLIARALPPQPMFFSTRVSRSSWIHILAFCVKYVTRPRQAASFLEGSLVVCVSPRHVFAGGGGACGFINAAGKPQHTGLSLVLQLYRERADELGHAGGGGVDSVPGILRVNPNQSARPFRASHYPYCKGVMIGVYTLGYPGA